MFHNKKPERARTARGLTVSNSPGFSPTTSTNDNDSYGCSGAAMQRYLQEQSTSVTSHDEGTHTSTEAEGEGEDEFPEWIAFGVVALAMALGILTRTTLAKWVP